MRLPFVLIFILALSSHARAQVWDIDYTHSSITFQVKHYFTPVSGRFQRFVGFMQYDEKNLLDFRVDFTVDVSTINTDNAKRDKDLLSPNFFNADKFPVMKFVANRVEKRGDALIAIGYLTIRDITKLIEVPFIILGQKDHPVYKNATLMGLQANFQIKRSEFAVGAGNWRSTLIVADEVDVTIALELTGKK
jgi:polyisoprenoid-binding protein YceI